MLHNWDYTRIAKVSEANMLAVLWHCGGDVSFYMQFVKIELSVKQQKNFCSLMLVLLSVIPHDCGEKSCISSVETGGEKKRSCLMKNYIKIKMRVKSPHLYCV